MFVTRSSTVGLAFALGVAGALPAAAAEPTKAECIAANENAQALQHAGRFTLAREQLAQCMSSSCPGILRADCADRIAEMDRVQPTIVFDAKDAAGRDLLDVTVTVDGQPFASRLDGRALPVDPGAHTFTFQAAGRPPVTQTFVLKEGEKERRERIALGRESEPEPKPASGALSSSTGSASEPVPPDASSPGGVQRIAGIALGAGGVVSLVLGAAFGLGASSKWSSAQSECGTPATCHNYQQGLSDHDAASTDATISTVTFVVGALLVGGGAALFFTAPKQEGASTSLTVAPSIGSRSAGVALRMGF